MKAGTIIELPDSRRGTVVYNGLDGVGIMWGEHNISMDDIKGGGGLFKEDIPNDYEFMPEAMLRDSYPSADLPCVGTKFIVIKRRNNDQQSE